MMDEPLIGDTSLYSDSLLVSLYAGHFLARWGARMWEFSVGLYMINVWPDSLFLAAAYGVTESASTALLGPLIGRLVNRLSYVEVLRLWLFCQNVSFMAAGVAVVAILAYPDGAMAYNHTPFICLVVLINVCGALGSLSTLAGTILIEREWAVVISEGEHPSFLAKMNSILRRIDLSCKLLAPVVTGFIISFVSMVASAVTLALWNILSVILQYWLLMSVYNGIPVLSRRGRFADESERVGFVWLESSDSNVAESSRSSSSCWRATMNRLVDHPYVSAWRLYLKQDVVIPGLALALLYFTVLSFGTLMTATLEWEGVPTFVIGLGRGLSAVIGIGATFSYPVLESRISSLRAGLWSIWSQWSCLLLCIGSIWVKERVSSAYMLMGGVAASRLGLWMFDLAVIQQMQDHVAESDRCVVGGVQNSIQSFLDLMTYVMGLIISNPQDFWKLTVISFVLVSMAAGLYTLHVYKLRKHLIHLEKLNSYWFSLVNINRFSNS